jgi:muramoyltetrapeptide carboxypeptidase LdcA involved in peptidoglycan recycling
MLELDDRAKKITGINSMRFKNLFNYGDTIGIIACSDGISYEYNDKLKNIINILSIVGIKVVLSKTLFKKNGPFSGTAIERAVELIRFFKDDTINGIFDISGGESANQILEYID